MKSKKELRAGDFKKQIDVFNQMHPGQVYYDQSHEKILWRLNGYNDTIAEGIFESNGTSGLFKHYKTQRQELHEEDKKRKRFKQASIKSIKLTKEELWIF